ncbi:plasmid pRiA4b ORF-3 family protein [Flavobacterium jejuense]|uniref:Plasmid pRiA4b ORF-3 family protein n=1 Tax=Flavobacterium jejuense TaxID=1544455 RepID=A0ABX0IMX7_9FLAO|nr:plasmid pRiA4b ORF-3 family protein [Flavobacterium jejuense]NHN24385.1 plasmid pRiA4b ORF-3 family protein [Flavobacterium jejuense]
MIYKFRAILDAEEDIFRDIAIEKEATLEDLHNALVNAFGFDGTEMASFYTCDETWNQEDEIPLFDTGDIPGEMRIMNNFILEDNLDKYQTKIIYVYDFFNMWTFLVELAAIEEKVEGETYPSLLFSHGQLPLDAPDKTFEAEDFGAEFNDDYDEDDLDAFDGDDSFEDFGFEENWN